MEITRRDFLGTSLACVALPLWPADSFAAVSSAHDELWYKQPAERWLQALPIGNGHLGAMVFGGTQLERIALSESTAWSGEESTGEVNPEALSHLPHIRQLFFEGKYSEASELCARYLLARPRNFGTNLPLPALLLHFEGIGKASEYRRFLNLDEAVAGVAFQSGQHTYRREVIASHADNLLAVRLESSDPRGISFQLEFEETSLPCSPAEAEGHTLILRGYAHEKKHSDGRTGTAFTICAQVTTDGGSVQAIGQSLHVKEASAVTIKIAVGTSFRGGDPERACFETLRRSERIDYGELRRRHLADYQPLYRRVSLQLGNHDSSAYGLPTDIRRRNFNRDGHDPDLIALFFHYGRYLTIAGSRHDSPLPLALQGIWNDGLASGMGWTDDFHLDINTQQNYWASEVCNLSECQTPLFGLVETMRVSGRVTARDMYGVNGWVAHTVTNPWGYSAPGWGTGWGLFVCGGIWIARQLWEHYLYTGNRDFLQVRAYPALREAAEFFLAYMVREPKHGWLVTGPSDSPENWYVAPDGGRAAEAMGNTCDRVLVYGLFSACIEASTILSRDVEFRRKLKSALALLPPFQIGRHGQLQEWLEDYEDADPNHRHTSHLTALFPEHQISPRNTPALARAAEVTIERRMNTPNWEQSEWGRANLVVYYARLLKGNLAYKYLVSLVDRSADDNLLTFSAAGIAGAEQNIFAIDGNTAGTAGIAEMLLQSHAGEIELLPSLPEQWATGSVAGLCARGGYVVGMRWRGGTLVSACISSNNGGSIPVRYRNQVKTIHLNAGEMIELTAHAFSRQGQEATGVRARKHDLGETE